MGILALMIVITIGALFFRHLAQNSSKETTPLTPEIDTDAGVKVGHPAPAVPPGSRLEFVEPSWWRPTIHLGLGLSLVASVPLALSSLFFFLLSLPSSGGLRSDGDSSMAMMSLIGLGLPVVILVAAMVALSKGSGPTARKMSAAILGLSGAGACLGTIATLVLVSGGSD